MLPVQGTVLLNNGGATLQLQLLGQPRPTQDLPGSPPSAAQILQSIAEGEIVLHHSRMPINAKEIATMICDQQSALGLARGRNGGWNEEAWDRLKKLLAGVKRQRGQATLALLDLGAAPPVPGAANFDFL